ncbi:DUF2207 domain-containing protein [Paenibacillus xerothermodurans]|uniref:DUF2207 domain-containing protein n=1 Tax=Paenibacillus xerothermodurans TaxID=1977292 RepID=A0A2W1NEY0_PAEXE|nr:DUF2207 domain-containing protein [Paenibacillus xerothermodurans]PZE21601.1 DUF2207 domain-containing protein [Paenibacillus xerothermodurans]
MNKWLALLLLPTVLFLSGWETGEDYTIDQVSARAQVLPDGDMYVEELFTYTFDGSYSGTKRYLQEEGHNGIEFFEAYVAPNNQPLGRFSHEGLQPLKVEYNADDYTFYIYNAAYSATKQVYYRYRVDQAASKYVRTGELDWQFFTGNERPLANVTLDIILPRAFNKDQIHVFLQDRRGGQITNTSGTTIQYKNAELAVEGTAELRLLFPSEFLTEAPTKSRAVRIEQILQEEQQREMRFAARPARLALAEQLIVGLLVLLLIGIAAYISPAAKLIGWVRRKEITPEQLENTDPVLISYIYRKGRMKKHDFIAGVFALHRKGYIRIYEETPQKRFLDDPAAPDTVLRFVFTGDRSQLSDAELHLMKWLFRRPARGEPAFTLDAIAGPTKTEQRYGARANYYYKKLTAFEERFRVWLSLLQASEPFASLLGEYTPMKRLVRPLMAMHYVVLLYLYYADVMKWQALAITASVLGILALWAGYKYRRKRYTVLFLVFCFIFGAQPASDGASGGYLVTVLLSFLFLWAIPRTRVTREAAQLRYAIASWRRRLKRGEDYVAADTARLERAMACALVLNVGGSFIKSITPRGSESGMDTYPSALLRPAAVQAILYTQSSLAVSVKSSSSGSSGDSGSYSSSDSCAADSSGGGDGGGGGD